MEKTVEYSKLRKPYIINNLEAQFDIQDRRKVYKLLEEQGIEIPRYAILDRYYIFGYVLMSKTKVLMPKFQKNLCSVQRLYIEYR